MRIAKRIAVIGVLAGVLLSTTMVSATDIKAPQKDWFNEPLAKVTSKDEVVYATLAPSGSISGVYVVNHFDVAEAGRIEDNGAYSEVKNLTDMSNISKDGDKVIFGSEKGDYYYQGNLASPDLPWLFDIKYKLDGKDMTATELAGQSGSLEIAISIKKKADSVFTDNYMLQVSLSLENKRAANVKADGATIANAGSSRMLTFTVMPGAEADFVITSDVNDFTYSGIDIAGIPFAMDIDISGYGGMLGALDELPAAISSLNSGVTELRLGVAEMTQGAAGLVAGSSEIGQGLSALSLGSGDLVGASSQIDASLKQIAGAIDTDSLKSMDMSQLGQLSGGLKQMSAALKQLADGVKELQSGFGNAYTALDQAISTIPPANAVSEADIAALFSQVNADSEPTLNFLVDNYKAAQTVSGTYSQIKPAFEATNEMLKTITASLSPIATQLGTIGDSLDGALAGIGSMAQLEQLASGLGELSAGYTEFHKGLVGYTGGVDAIANNYSAFDTGLVQFGDGVNALHDGITELNNGTTQMAEETANMPEQIESQIEEIKDEYLSSDFTPVSFTGKNNKTDFVQFVIKCEGITKPEPPALEQASTEKNVIDRLIDLFR